MIILFTLWFILQWQFPTWLWIFSGFFYVVSLRPKKKVKKQVSFNTKTLPLYLALAIYHFFYGILSTLTRWIQRPSLPFKSS